MIERVHVIAEPALPTATLWRFMDFTKYVAMLQRGALFFTRADQLPDPFEGLAARGNHRVRAERRESDGLRRRVFLSCWHQNEHESAAMWRIYLSSEAGVAVRSSVERLRASLATTREALHLGVVRYLDYERERVPEHHEFEPFFCKRKSFEYEREVRALWHADTDLDEPGRYISAELERLIEQVIVSPIGEPWFEELVRSVTEKYGFELPVAPSKMMDPPVFEDLSMDR
jgi:hypothetical protein